MEENYDMGMSTRKSRMPIIAPQQPQQIANNFHADPPINDGIDNDNLDDLDVHNLPQQVNEAQENQIINEDQPIIANDQLEGNVVERDIPGSIFNDGLGGNFDDDNILVDDAQEINDQRQVNIADVVDEQLEENVEHENIQPGDHVEIHRHDENGVERLETIVEFCTRNIREASAANLRVLVYGTAVDRFDVITILREEIKRVQQIPQTPINDVIDQINELQANNEFLPQVNRAAEIIPHEPHAVTTDQEGNEQGVIFTVALANGHQNDEYLIQVPEEAPAVQTSECFFIYIAKLA